MEQLLALEMIRVLTADVTVANNGLGNLVDLDNGVVRVRVQAPTRVERKELPLLVVGAIGFDFGIQASLIAHQTIVYGLEPPV